MTSALVSIVTINYRSSPLIHRIEAMVQDLPEAVLLVVDNSGEFVPSQSTTTVLRPPGNLGFGRACNIGAEAAGTEFVLFLNPDAEASPTLVRELIRRAPPDMSIWGPGIRDRAGRISRLSIPGRFGLKYRRQFIGKGSERSEGNETVFVSGACMMTRTRFFKRIGGFNREIFLYGEDLELCERARASGAIVRVLADICVAHQGGRSCDSARARALRLVRSVAGHYRCLAPNMSKISALYNALYLALGIRG